MEELVDEERLIFSSDEAKEIAARHGWSLDYLYVLLHTLTRSGWLMHLRRGLYAVTGKLSPEAQPHPFAIATRLVVPSAISHWSAMSFHGLTEQIPRVVTAMTPKKVVTPSMRAARPTRLAHKHGWEIAGTRYEYVTVKPDLFFGIEDVWLDQHFKVPITDKERTMLEGFASPSMFGGMGEILGILEERLGELHLDKLVAYAVRYGKAAPAKRLGWALEHMGIPQSDLTPLQEIPVSGFRLLDPVHAHHGPCDRRWMIQDNLSPEAAP